MKSFKMNGLNKLVSLILIAVVLICTVGFAAGGWQSDPNDEPDSGEVGDNTDKTDENKDGNNEQTDGGEENTPPADENPDNSKPQLPSEDIKEPIIEPPKYYSSVTGLEITEEQLNSTPYGFVLNPQKPLYGISDSDLTVEFPIEDGSTRILSYVTDAASLWKVGSLSATRAFISSTSNFFGGIVVSYGNDDVVKYSAWDTSKLDLDISKFTDCYYIENTLYIYTNGTMVKRAYDKASILTSSPYKSAPYSFAENGNEVIGATKATSVIIPYSSTNETEFYYSETSQKYLYFKSGERKVDMLNGKNISFGNIFILFANATTYENADGTELVLDTVAGGSGYYISKGHLTEMRWSVNESGALEFKSLSGDELTVNRGNAYIGYFKASNASKITFG
jgi:hypothetical protein